MYEVGDTVLFQGRYYTVVEVKPRDLVIIDDEGYNLIVSPLTVSFA